MNIANNRFNVRRLLYGAAALLAALMIAVIPALASADQLTERSVSLSSSSISAPNVQYKVQFTPAANAGAFVVDFCSNTPLVGFSCDRAADFDASGATSATSGFTDVETIGADDNTVVVTGPMTADNAVTVDIDGITNPSVDGTMYARIITYENKAAALLYEPASIGEDAIDNGAVALAITPTIGVSGLVLETLTFCVSGEEIGPGCTNTTAPVLRLGNETAPGSGVYALAPGVLSEGQLYTQITTNASGGVVVRLKSSTEGCGGLVRAGSNVCGILPATATSLGLNENDNTAKFGVRTSAATDTPAVNATGQFVPAEGSIYSNTVYAFNYVEDDELGVTSPFGDPFLDTAHGPATGKNMALTFGATVSTDTAAGNYTADLSMIAVGKF